MGADAILADGAYTLASGTFGILIQDDGCKHKMAATRRATPTKET